MWHGMQHGNETHEHDDNIDIIRALITRTTIIHMATSSRRDTLSPRGITKNKVFESRFLKNNSNIKLLCLYLPLRDRALLGGEADADLDDPAAVRLVGDGIALVVDLLERFLHSTVEFQLHDVDGGVGLHEDIHPALCRTHLGVDIDVEE